MADDLLTAALERFVNRYLALDPEIAARLGEFEGKCLHFDCTLPPLSLNCLPRAGAMTLASHCEREPDCRVSGSAFALARLARTDQPTPLLASGEVTIEGDSRLVQRFADVLKQLEVDWEEQASRVLGDFAAHRLGNAVRAFQRWAAGAGESLRRDTTEYLQEESGVLPAPSEIESFIANVDELRLAADRLEARIKRLERVLATKDASP